MSSFRDVSRHFGVVPPQRIRSLTAIAERRGRQDLFRQQHPAGLETLRQVAMIQSTESSNAIEDIRAPRARIEALVAEKTMPRNRPEQEIAGYRFVLDQVHANAATIPFEPRFVEQLHGYLYRFTPDTSAGHWKAIDNAVEEHHPDGTVVERFKPVSAAMTPEAMRQLHEGFNSEFEAGTFSELLLVAAYVLDFLVIHPFRDGNGRMARIISLWLSYRAGHEVGRYVSFEKLIEDTRSSYYDSLGASTLGWHLGEHDLGPWTDYFLGIMLAAYDDFENRTSQIAGRGAKRERIESFIRSGLSDEFTISQVREASPGTSDAYINRVLASLKAAGEIESLGRGRSARWRRIN